MKNAHNGSLNAARLIEAVHRLVSVSRNAGMRAVVASSAFAVAVFGVADARAEADLGDDESLESVHAIVLYDQDEASLYAVLESFDRPYLRVERPEELAVVILTPSQDDQALDEALVATGFTFESADLPLDMFMGADEPLPEVFAKYAVVGTWGEITSYEPIQMLPYCGSQGADCAIGVCYNSTPPATWVYTCRCNGKSIWIKVVW